MKEANENLKEEVLEKLEWDDRIEPSGIRLDLEEGEVTVSGSVPSYSAKQAVWEEITTTPGVTGVLDEMSVEYPPNLPVPADEEIRTHATSIFMMHSGFNTDRIDLKADNGQVDLEGTVQSYWQKKRAESLISDIHGVKSVQNKLSVVPTDQYTDKVIAEKIVRLYEKHGYFDPEMIDVKVQDGVVTLSGILPNGMVKREAIQLISYIPGIRDIADNLSVRE